MNATISKLVALVPRKAIRAAVGVAAAILAILAILAIFNLQAVLGGLLTVVVFLVLLNGIVFVHEFAHLVVARLSGVRVREFGLGFPMSRYGLARLGFDRAIVSRTKWGIKWSLYKLPLGGFNELVGETFADPEVGERYSFARAASWKKVLICVAGPASNLALAVVILMAVFSAYIIEVKNIALADIPASLPQILSVAFTLSMNIIGLVLSFTGTTLANFLPNIVSQPLDSPLIGTVGMVSAVGSTMGQGYVLFGVLAASVSLGLALINILPIVPFDGGRALVEAVRGLCRAAGRVLSPRVQLAYERAGVRLFTALIIYSQVPDIIRMVIGYKPSPEQYLTASGNASPLALLPFAFILWVIVFLPALRNAIRGTRRGLGGGGFLNGGKALTA